MKSIKISLLFCSIILGSTLTQAQEISISANGGFQGLDYKVNNGNNDIKIGGRVGIGYTYFFNKNWGILSGAELGYFANKTTLNNGTYISYEVDTDTDAFEYRVETDNYREKNHFYTVSIPLMAQYRTTGNTQFYINGGGRVFFPFSQKTEASAGEIVTSGYYGDVNAVLENMPNHGFGTVSNWNNDSKSTLKTAFALSAETGVSFKLSEKLRLYTGAYIDYGLNNIKKNDKSVYNVGLVNYSSEGLDKIEANSTLRTTGEVDKAKLLAYGIQIKLGFSTSKTKKNEVIEEPKDNILINSLVEEPKTETIEVVEVKEVAKTMNEEQIKFVEENILFKTIGNTTLSEENILQLNEVSKILKEYPQQKVEIQGYTCSIGSDERNERVRLKRAQTVTDYLKTNGVNTDQYQIKSVIDYAPLFPNNTEANRQKNRRAVIKIVK